MSLAVRSPTARDVPSDQSSHGVGEQNREGKLRLRRGTGAAARRETLNAATLTPNTDMRFTWCTRTLQETTQEHPRQRVA